MRWIIIPLIVILYIFWSYKSIQDILTGCRYPYSETYRDFWEVITCLLIIVTVGYFSIKYW